MSTPRKFSAGKGATGGKLRGKAASSRRQPKARGIDPGKPAYGIVNTGTSSEQKLAARATGMFGNGTRNTPDGQGRLSGKAKRQVK